MITNLFGTDGIRKTVGQSPFTAHELPLLGWAIGNWLRTKYSDNIEILIAHDTRQSAAFIKAALKTGLLAHPITIHDAQILPTPAVSRLVQKHATMVCGIVISASHNPYQDNGIKIFDASGNKLSQEDSNQINALFYEAKNNFVPTYTHFGSEHNAEHLAQSYISSVCALFTPHFLSGIRVTLDCAHGATHAVAPQIFEQLGAHVDTLCTAYNGININDRCGSEHPQYTQQAVIENKTDIGFAFDGDGDRVVAINKMGVIKNGDHILATLLDHLHYTDQPTIVGTEMTNQGLAVYVQQKNKQLLRTPVGDVHVIRRLTQENLLLGGEQSGHIIMRDISNNADGIITALRIMEAILHSGNWHMETFTPFPQKLINVPISQKKDLSKPPLSTLIEQSAAQLDKNSRLLVRYSGTESIIRVMIEDANETHAQTICTELSLALKKELLIA